MRLKISTSSAADGVYLYPPVRPDEVSEAFAQFERNGVNPAKVRIVAVSEHLPYIGGYALRTDIHNAEEVQKLNALAEAIDQMDEKAYSIFEGALHIEEFKRLDDIIALSKRLDDYVLLPHIKNDVDLCQHLLDIGFKDCPEDMRGYLNFEAVGRDFRVKYGGAYAYGGYVRRKDSVKQVSGQRNVVITLHLAVEQMEYRLCLPAEDAELELVKEQLGICDFAEANIAKTECDIPYIGEMVCSLGCPSVEAYNLLSEELKELQETNGALLTYAAVLEVEQPETVEKAWELVQNLDDYERIIDGTYEYGQTVLRRHGADDEIITAIEGYMDFDSYGADAQPRHH